MSFFTIGMDTKPASSRLPRSRLKLFTQLEHQGAHSQQGDSSLWNGSSRMHLEALDSHIPDDSVSDADLLSGQEAPNIDDMDELVPSSFEESMSAANTLPDFVLQVSTKCH
jgi:hypothetical protein